MKIDKIKNNKKENKERYIFCKKNCAIEIK